MGKTKVVVAISDATLREHVVAGMRLHSGLDIAAIADPHELLGRPSGGMAVLWQTRAARRASQEYHDLMQLRRQWVLLAAYDEPHLLEASSLFDVVDGWLPVERIADATPELLKLASEGLALLPGLEGRRLRLDELRRARLASLPPLTVRAFIELSRGSTNRQISKTLNLPVEHVSALLRQGMDILCLRNRLEAAVFAARTMGDALQIDRASE